MILRKARSCLCKLEGQPHGKNEEKKLCKSSLRESLFEAEGIFCAPETRQYFQYDCLGELRRDLAAGTVCLHFAHPA